MTGADRAVRRRRRGSGGRARDPVCPTVPARLAPVSAGCLDPPAGRPRRTDPAAAGSRAICVPVSRNASRTISVAKSSFMKSDDMWRNTSGPGSITTAGMPQRPRIRNSRSSSRRQMRRTRSEADLLPTSPVIGDTTIARSTRSRASASAFVADTTPPSTYASPLIRTSAKYAGTAHDAATAVDSAGRVGRDPKIVRWRSRRRTAAISKVSSGQSSPTTSSRKVRCDCSISRPSGSRTESALEREAPTARGDPRQPEHGRRRRAAAARATCARSSSAGTPDVGGASRRRAGGGRGARSRR